MRLDSDALPALMRVRPERSREPVSNWLSGAEPGFVALRTGAGFHVLFTYKLGRDLYGMELSAVEPGIAAASEQKAYGS